MAILKGINGGNFSGSVGKVTFRKGLKGDIIASQKAESVSNPKTTPQQEQRMLMKTAITAYSTLKKICCNSFEGVKQGQKNQAEFVKRNIEILRSDIDTHAFTKYNVGGFAPNKYIISHGSLFGFKTIYKDNFFDLGFNNIIWKASENDNTWASFKSKFNLLEGDQILIVALCSLNDNLNTWDVAEQEDIICAHAKYVFKDTIPEDEKIIDYDTLVVNNNLFKNIVKNGVFLGLTGPADSGLRITPEYGKYIWSAGVVVSRKVGNKWEHSTTYLVNAGSKIPDPYKYNNVLQTYKPSGTKYLNNANI